jgi:acyl carrier protein
MTPARVLVAAVLDSRPLLDRIADSDDLTERGVNSGDLVRIALRCEEQLDRQLSDDELAGLSSIEAIDRILRSPGLEVS